MERTEVRLGCEYRDRISGFKGIATARHEYLNGCVRVTISPQELRDGKPIEAQNFDVEDMEMESEGIAPKVKPTGGPGAIPPPRSTPSR